MFRRLSIVNRLVVSNIINVLLLVSVVVFSNLSFFTNSFTMQPKTIFIINVIITLIAIIITVNISCSIIKSFKKSMRDFSSGLDEIMMGKLNVDFSAETKEFSELSEKLTGMTEVLKLYIGETARILNSLSQNDLRVNVEVDFKGDFVTIKQVLETIIGNLNAIIHKISVISAQVDASSRDIAEGAKYLSSGAQEQSNSVENIVVFITSIASHIEKNLASIEMINSSAKTIFQSADETNKNSAKMKQAMEAIMEFSKKIGAIVKNEEDIAFQTNILAINAAIEAANAGEVGKGFAIVAGEVRTLSLKSSDSAKNTSELIKHSLDAILEGKKITDLTEDEIGKIFKLTQEASDAMREVTLSYENQKKEIDQLARGLTEISVVTQNNSATSEESAAKSEELFYQASALKELVGSFKTK